MNNLSRFIDLTFLKQEASFEQIENICDEAVKYRYKAVCVFPQFLPIVVKKLKGTDVLPITVIDFPGGEASPEEKARQTEKAVALGAKELDMVIDVLALKDRKYELVFEGIRRVVKAAGKLPVKVIIETCYLNKNEIVAACVLAKLAKAGFVKTSTGFAKAGAKAEDIILIRSIVGADMGVKASGGIKSKADAELMINAGADRIGSSTIVLLEKKS